jgi:hypothetical protein
MSRNALTGQGIERSRRFGKRLVLQAVAREDAIERGHRRDVHFAAGRLHHDRIELRTSHAALPARGQHGCRRQLSRY